MENDNRKNFFKAHDLAHYEEAWAFINAGIKENDWRAIFYFHIYRQKLLVNPDESEIISTLQSNPLNMNLLTQAAENQDPEALYLMSYVYRYGLQGKESIKKSSAFLKMSSDAGFPLAQIELGYSWTMNYFDKRHIKKGLELLMNNVTSSVDAQYHLAKYLLPYYSPIDQLKGESYLKKAAEQGHAKALSFLGKSYVNGQFQKDLTTAYSCLEKAMFFGEPMGTVLFALHPFNENTDQRKKFLIKAAKQGYKPAIYQIVEDYIAEYEKSNKEN